jgi:hypothetical protein
MSRKYREDGILAQTPAADYSIKLGYLVDLAAGVATISASATVPAKGVIIEENDTTAGFAGEKVSVAILGNIQGSVPMRASGAIAAGAKVQQAADGTVVTDAGAGARVVVGIAAEAGVAGENIEVFPITPVVLA